MTYFDADAASDAEHLGDLGDFRRGLDDNALFS